MTSLPRLSDIWQGCFTPPSHCSYQGIRAMEKSIEEIPMVQECLDVFPDDLPGIPPERALSSR
jgi:hypothetical protein